MHRKFVTIETEATQQPRFASQQCRKFSLEMRLIKPEYRAKKMFNRSTLHSVVSCCLMLINQSLGSAIAQPFVRGSMHQSQMNVLLHWERLPPLAVKAAADIAGVSIELKTDPKFGKDSLPLLLLQSSRCANCLTQSRALIVAQSIILAHQTRLSPNKEDFCSGKSWKEVHQSCGSLLGQEAQAKSFTDQMHWQPFRQV